MVAGYSGVILIVSAYLVAFFTRTKLEAVQNLETSLQLVESTPEGDEKGGKAQNPISSSQRRMTRRHNP